MSGFTPLRVDRALAQGSQPWSVRTPLLQVPSSVRGGSSTTAAVQHQPSFQHNLAYLSRAFPPKSAGHRKSTIDLDLRNDARALCGQLLNINLPRPFQVPPCRTVTAPPPAMATATVVLGGQTMTTIPMAKATRTRPPAVDMPRRPSNPYGSRLYHNNSIRKSATYRHDRA